MKTRVSVRLLVCSLSLAFGSAIAEEHVVGQRDRVFLPQQLTVRVGDTVKFTNDDPFLHNVFSLSAAATFDVGSFPEGDARVVKFNKPGTVDVECVIHPDMRLIIEVAK